MTCLSSSQTRLSSGRGNHWGRWPGRAVIYPDYGHQIPVEVRNRDIDPFIEGVLGKTE